ncbi:MAG: 50S ribosomal protein L4 [Arsenophonus sp.]|nr:MAG: 50S ribosomal protein L4 [Arsenophonus sp.]
MELLIQDNKKTITISDSIFKQNFNTSLVHQVITAYSACKRQNTSAQKTRSLVSGSGKKPWRQKGTGRARAGSTKSPIWRSGGVTFTSKFKKYRQKINKKMYKGALKSIFSELIRQKRLILMDQIIIELPKTKLLLKKIKEISSKKILIIISEFNQNLLLSARNLHNVNIHYVYNINPVNLINFDYTIITTNAIKKIEGILECNTKKNY